MPRRINVRATASLAAIGAIHLLGGCAVGPDYKSPRPETPEVFTEAAPPAGGEPTSRVNVGEGVWATWWSAFGDRELDSLVERAIEANHELRAATARVTQARAVEQMAESRLYPQIGFSAGAFATRGSENGFGIPYGIPGVSSNLYQVGFDAAYEVDIFGGVRRSIEAASDVAAAIEDDRRILQVTLLAEVARDYIALRSLQQRLTIARANLDDQRRTADIVSRRFDEGLVPNFDVVRARSQVTATESKIPPFEAAIRQRMHALAVLLGAPPLALADELATMTPIPPVPPQVPVGLPSELLRRRPDVRRAERLLAAANAEEGVAIADYFPRFVLGGSAGVQSRHGDDLFKDDSDFHLGGAALQWTLFDGGRRAANHDRAEARIAEARASYEETVLGSLRDVEGALTSYTHDQTRRGSLRTLVSQSEETVRIARGQYEQGIVALLDVLDAQRNLHVAEDDLAQAEQAVSSDLVALYKALGGGWEAIEARTTAPEPTAAVR